ncbi:SMI1/KNR4 family protein [uncultured Nostoc sp.]|uniref:SMI1/KNR4 family protein n=1 Tax=uncultured Nostoc sp. TaxID=340711 RepID=UPI0035CC840A
MAQFDWENLLKELSLKLIEYDVKESGKLRRDGTTIQPKLTPELRESGWLGYPEATEEHIISAETRLGIKFPPSYREFLKVSNGWRNADWTEMKLWSTDELEWFATRNQDWIDGWAPTYTEKRPTVPDDSYFVYGGEQDCINLRTEYLQNALEISSESSDGDIFLLIPDVVFDDEELEAWHFGSKLPGACRYSSFYELMQKVVEQGRFIY